MSLNSKTLPKGQEPEYEVSSGGYSIVWGRYLTKDTAIEKADLFAWEKGFEMTVWYRDTEVYTALADPYDRLGQLTEYRAADYDPSTDR